MAKLLHIKNIEKEIIMGENKNFVKEITNIDGYLIGGSSSKIDEFIQIIKQIDKK